MLSLLWLCGVCTHVQARALLKSSLRSRVKQRAEVGFPLMGLLMSPVCVHKQAHVCVLPRADTVSESSGRSVRWFVSIVLDSCTWRVMRRQKYATKQSLAVQGLAGMQLPGQQLRQLLANIADHAAFGSMVVGELPGVPLQMAEVRC